MLIRLFLLLLSVPVYATVFQVQPVTQQIREADGIIQGHFLRSQPVKLENGSIATQMIFKMNKEIGMQSELFGMDEIIIHYPGGKIGDVITSVEGVPKFIPGEKVVVMVKSYEDRFWGMNLGFGSFKVINYGNEKLIVNTIFPKNRVAGQMKMEDFEKQVRLIKGSRMKVVYAPGYPSEKIKNGERAPASTLEEGKNRAIASKTDQGENGMATEEGLNPFWLVLLLAILGGMFRLSRQKEAR